MGVYIKGQEMPETCNDCEFLDLDTFDYEMHAACGFTGEIVTYDLRHGRNEKCPLVEVTEPHGRLIDESQIMTVYGEAMTTRYQGYISRTEKITHTDAPTVIEAEDE